MFKRRLKNYHKSEYRKKLIVVLCVIVLFAIVIFIVVGGLKKEFKYSKNLDNPIKTEKTKNENDDVSVENNQEELPEVLLPDEESNVSSNREEEKTNSTESSLPKTNGNEAPKKENSKEKPSVNNVQEEQEKQKEITENNNQNEQNSNVEIKDNELIEDEEYKNWKAKYQYQTHEMCYDAALKIGEEYAINNPNFRNTFCSSGRYKEEVGWALEIFFNDGTGIYYMATE